MSILNQPSLGESAPILLKIEDHDCWTMRDEFAKAAMQAAATSEVGANGFTFEQRAEWAYLQADAMLEARKGTK